MTPHERDVVRQYLRGWPALAAAVDVDSFITGAKAGAWGCSGFTVAGRQYWMQTAAKGIELRVRLGAERDHLVPWRVFREWATSLPQAARDEAAELRRIQREHQASHVAYAPPSADVCHGTPEWNAARTAWYREHADPFHAENRRITALEHDWLDRWLPAAEAQLDLFGEPA